MKNVVMLFGPGEAMQTKRQLEIRVEEARRRWAWGTRQVGSKLGGHRYPEAP